MKTQEMEEKEYIEHIKKYHGFSDDAAIHHIKIVNDLTDKLSAVLLCTKDTTESIIQSMKNIIEVMDAVVGSSIDNPLHDYFKSKVERRKK